jgi:hypothetical protein
MITRLEDCRDLNRLHWRPGVKSFFEVQYLRFHDPRQRLVGWFRFVLQAPRQRPPELTVWASVFSLDRPEESVVTARTFPLELVTLDPAGQGMQLPSAGFSERRWWGQVGPNGSELSYSLELLEGEASFVHLRRPLYHLGLLPMKLLSPFSRVSLSGNVTVRGRPYRLENLMANHSHYWGHRLVDRRVWAFCNSFEDDPTLGFEGASGKLRIAGISLPRTSFLCLHRRGDTHTFNSPLQSLLTRSRHDLLSWNFSTGNRYLRLRGRAWVDSTASMLAHRYESPDGIPAHNQFIHLDSSANLELEISERLEGSWRVTQRSRALRLAALESSLPTLDPRVSWVVG